MLSGPVSTAAPPGGQVSIGEFLISEVGGSALYIFDSSGRHHRTVNALTGAVIHQFSYDDAGRLIAVADAYGNATTIERDPAGEPIGITGPFGTQTVLRVDPPGTLREIVNPSGGAVRAEYSTDGLLNTLTDPLGNIYTFEYDGAGRLISDRDPTGGSTALMRTPTDAGFRTTILSAALREKNFVVEWPSAGLQRRTSTCCGGGKMVEETYDDGRRIATIPNGTVVSVQFRPDPRWNLQAPLAHSVEITMPSGRSLVRMTDRQVDLADPADPLSLSSISEVVSINANRFATTYTATTRRVTLTTPEGRTTTATLDAAGRVVEVHRTGLLLVTFAYGSYGKLFEVSQESGSGTRKVTLTYNMDGNLSTVIDPLGRTTSFGYDMAGRLTSQSFPSGGVANYEYDTNGNLTGLTPPGRPTHRFTFTGVDQRASYQPPNVNGGTLETRYEYDADGYLARLTRPGKTAVDFTVDEAGRLSAAAVGRGHYRYDYHPITGMLTNISEPTGGQLTYRYDGLLLTQITWAGLVSGSLERAFDDNLLLRSESVNGAMAAEYVYDRDGLPLQVGQLSLIRDSATGLVTDTALGAVTTQSLHNSFGELVSMTASHKETVLYESHYLYDLLGRVIQRTETIAGQESVFNYAYDGDGRLATAQRDTSPAVVYAYDVNGNRTG